jgi:hypothetical protein
MNWQGSGHAQVEGNISGRAMENYKTPKSEQVTSMLKIEPKHPKY